MNVENTFTYMKNVDKELYFFYVELSRCQILCQQQTFSGNFLSRYRKTDHNSK